MRAIVLLEGGKWPRTARSLGRGSGLLLGGGGLLGRRLLPGLREQGEVVLGLDAVHGGMRLQVYLDGHSYSAPALPNSGDA